MINTKTGLERWFSDDVQKHEAKAEGKIIMGIYRYRCIYDITKLSPFSYIEWFCFDTTDCVQFNTRICFRIEPLGEGGISLVEFEHTGWNSLNMSYFDNYEKGWKSMLEKLKMSCENPDFKSPWSFKTPLAIEVSTPEIQSIFNTLTYVEQLKRWFSNEIQEYPEEDNDFEMYFN